MISFSKKNRWFIVIVLLAVVILTFVFGSKKSRPLEGLVFRTTRPFAQFFSAVGQWTKQKVYFFSEIGNLKEQNEKLLKENNLLRSKTAKMQEIENENQTLRNQLEIAPREKYQLEAAFVSGKDLSGKEEIIYINKGSKHGVEEGMAVVVDDGILVGKITSAEATMSKVELILSKEIIVNAEILESQAKGIVGGEYGTSAAIDMVPLTIELNKDDTVVTSSSSGKIPQGLLIGYIKEPILTADKLFQRSSLILPIEFSRLSLVWVLKSAK